ncbi:hypothetical protein [Massilia rubra]|uniref:DUF4410 domain-containing protein n=1 Tax=Massilia rubra TaxID=2607910 RepID=A0ABX0LHF2_9BURK|nr:hypothetical protein [Massilia rubra]NHZ34028.1 hypothetical protein [Massilia rubra]
MNHGARIATLLSGGLLLLQLTGCAVDPLQVPRASAINSAKLKDANFTPAAIDTFKLDPARNPGMDKILIIRAGTVAPPTGSTFSQYLRDTLKVELESAGLYDPAAKTVITGTLTTSEVDTSAFRPAEGKLGARFGVTRDGVTRYDRTLNVQTTWANVFDGSEAIPIARGQYEVLYKRLVGALFDDPDFRKAMSKE